MEGGVWGLRSIGDNESVRVTSLSTCRDFLPPSIGVTVSLPCVLCVCVYVCVQNCVCVFVCVSVSVLSTTST